MPIANPIAYVMLAIWPVVAWILFTKLDRARALIWTMLGAYLLLPPVVAINLPVVPNFHKHSIASLSAVAAVVFLHRERFLILPSSVRTRVIMVLCLIGPSATVLTNGDPIFFYTSSLPAMRIYDLVAVVTNQLIALFPFFLGRRYLGTDEGMRAILVALVAAGLVYSLPMLWEARMSPQLNQTIYGFFQHDFSQAIRGGGFRPFVFLQHGLWVAFFAMMCFVSAVALLRTGPSQARPLQLLIALYLLVVLVFCRSVGPMIYAILLSVLVLLFPRRIQVVCAALMVVVVISYPLLRGLQLVPVDSILSLAMDFNQERGQSLQFRLVNEELLLERANERPWFGWGIYGRGLLHDPVTGQINVIPDGGWIITLGTFGWVGYLGIFGTLALPIFMITREVMRPGAPDVSQPVAAVVLIFAANLFDLLPNDTLIPFSWLMAGAILGYAEALRAANKARSSTAILPTRVRTVL